MRLLRCRDGDERRRRRGQMNSFRELWAMVMGMAFGRTMTMTFVEMDEEKVQYVEKALGYVEILYTVVDLDAQAKEGATCPALGQRLVEVHDAGVRREELPLDGTLLTKPCASHRCVDGDGDTTLEWWVRQEGHSLGSFALQLIELLLPEVQLEKAFDERRHMHYGQVLDSCATLVFGCNTKSSSTRHDLLMKLLAERESCDLYCMASEPEGVLLEIFDWELTQTEEHGEGEYDCKSVIHDRMVAQLLANGFSCEDVYYDYELLDHWLQKVAKPAARCIELLRREAEPKLPVIAGHLSFTLTGMECGYT